jgi:hypothetical protein
MENVRFVIEAYVLAAALYGVYLFRLLRRARALERRIDGDAR